jgi:hypothetical protein
MAFISKTEASRVIPQRKKMTYGKKPKSYRETLRDNRRGENAWAAAFGKPIPYPSEQLPILLKPKKTAIQLPTRSEGDVQRDIISLLTKHPKVALVERINSGAMAATGADGKQYPIKFHRIYKSGLASPDVHVTLKGNARRMVIECKRPDWKAPDFATLEKRDGLIPENRARELAQWRYLQTIISAGGIGIFATSIDDVLNALEAA